MKTKAIRLSSRISAAVLSAGLTAALATAAGAKPPGFAGLPPTLLPPPTGTLDAGQPITFGNQSTVRLGVSNDRGACFQAVSTSATVTLSLATSSDGSECDAGVLALAVSRGELPGAMRVRESPTLSSGGRFSTIRCPDGSCRISSFIDIFTEISLDGGQSWSPASSGACALGQGHFFATDCFPPAADYACHTGDGTSFGSSGVVIRNFRHRPAAVRSPLPAAGVSATRSFDGVATGEVSRDGGKTFSPLRSACTGQVAIASVGGSRSGEDRQVESLALKFSLAGAASGTSSGSPAVMFRESPSKASTGKITICHSTASSRTSSFFDDFTEVSLDGGQRAGHRFGFHEPVAPRGFVGGPRAVQHRNDRAERRQRPDLVARRIRHAPRPARPAGRMFLPHRLVAASHPVTSSGFGVRCRGERPGRTGRGPAPQGHDQRHFDDPYPGAATGTARQRGL